MQRNPYNSSGRSSLPDENTLFIEDLDPSIKDDNLKELLSPCGKILRTTILVHPEPPNHAFVCFSTRQEAVKARDEFLYYRLGKWPIRVMFKNEHKTFQPKSKIIVENLDSRVTHKELHEYFKQEILDVAFVVIKDGRGII
jgi:RNA recognition motif-containing protein